MGTGDTPILFDDNLYHYREMLGPHRGWPFRQTRHIDWVEIYTGDSIPQWTDRVMGRYKVGVIHVRSEFNGLDPQLQVWLAAIGNVHFHREVALLKRHYPVVDGLEPARPAVVTEDGTVGFKTILGWVANAGSSFNQDTLKFMAAKSPLHISPMKTLERLGIGGRGKDFCANL